MKKEIVADIRSRPEFSRFTTNLENKSSLPIFPLSTPKDNLVGVMIVGDYIAQDLVQYLETQSNGLRSKWLIISTTQSDAIPLDCSGVDFNFFTNESGVEEYLNSSAKNVPFSTELGDGHYVDSEIFFPDSKIEKRWDIVYPAKWYPTKNTDLLLETAKLDPNLKIAIYGWPVVSERKIVQSMAYRNKIIETAQSTPNVEIFDAGFEIGTVNHYNTDGTVVIGNLSKEEMRDKFFRQAKSSIFLSETTEAVNRVCTEMLCCDVPMLVTQTNGGLEKLINDKTGVLIERSPMGILKGIHYIFDHQEQFNPRLSFLRLYGKEKANKRLEEIIVEVAKNKGVEVNWENMRKYSGDLWTSPDVYMRIFTS